MPGRRCWPSSLRAEGVVLRPLRRGDAATWREVRAHNQDWLRPWDATLPPTSEERLASGFGQLRRRLSAGARAGQLLPWAICVDPAWPEGLTPVDDLPLSGQLTVAGITLGAGRYAQIGYWIDQRQAGRGIVPTAVAMACDYCLDVLQLHRVEIGIRPENHNSLRVVQKLGLRHEGLRPQWLHIDGDWRDHEIFSVHTGDFPDGVLAHYLNQRSRPA